MAGTMATPAATPATSRSWLERLWSSVADRGRAYADVPGPGLPPLDRASRLAEALLSERGEASGAAVARELHDSMAALSPEDRLAFLTQLSEGFGPDPARLRAAVEAWLAEPGPAAAARLAEAAEPPRQELIRRMNMAPGGTARLVRIREELAAPARQHPVLRVLDADLKHLFASWFNRGFLELRRIDWQTPAAVLEKLIAYEAVHEIAGWEDLRRRLEADRRCFAFFHPALPGEPLIFVEVALVAGLATAVQPLLGRDAPIGDPALADTAIFYSISNCQEGLRGISFGNFLIKQVVEELKAELPQLSRFATLSPVPGFRRWLDRQLAGSEPVFTAAEAALLTATAGEDAAPAAFAALIADGWPADPAREDVLRAP
ncbi:MAG: Malonyl-CoA decarboxylase, partial [Belnapia sp.]|nr:Malonyl-CoA decarboxylase [Belnapia sp.]